MSRMKRTRLSNGIKELTDIAGLIVGILSAAVFMYGVMLLLCGEWVSMLWTFMGFAGIVMADECFRYGRKGCDSKWNL